MPPPTGHRWTRALGAGLILLGLVAAGIAVVSLRNPKGHQSSGATTIVSTITSGAGTTHFSSSSQPSSQQGSSTPRSPSSSRAPSSSPSGPHADVYILNNTDRTGLAAGVATSMRAKGWTVAGTGNYSNDIISSCAYYDPSDPANYQAALALQKQFPGIARVVQRFAQLPDYPIVVVLNPDYPG